MGNKDDETQGNEKSSDKGAENTIDGDSCEEDELSIYDENVSDSEIDNEWFD